MKKFGMDRSSISHPKLSNKRMAGFTCEAKSVYQTGSCRPSDEEFLHFSIKGGRVNCQDFRSHARIYNHNIGHPDYYRYLQPK